MYQENVTEYMTRLENECVDLCKDLLSLVSKCLMPKAKRAGNVEAMVYYLKI